MSIIASMLSCTKGDIIPEKELEEKATDSPEEILMAVSDKYTVEKVTESQTEYLFEFSSPSPISLKIEYPEGIRSVSILKSNVREYSENGKNISISFSDGKTTSLQYCSWLSVKFSTLAVNFEEGSAPVEYPFEILENDSDSLNVSVEGAADYATFDAVIEPNLKTGKIIFRPNTEGYFTSDVTVTVSNGKRIITQVVSLSRIDFKFCDGTVSREYSFPEYERYMEFELHSADTAVNVSIPDECKDWIQAKAVTLNVDDKDRTIICILLSENKGNVCRTGQVSVTRGTLDRTLPIMISQLGSDMDGSLRKGLESFFYALHGESWVKRDNWCSSKPLFDWYGIEAALVTSKSLFGDDGFAYFGTDDKWNLNLAANNMRGEIPSEFWKICTYFENIRISSEYLPTSTVPDCVWHKGLQTLDLSMSFMNVPLSVAVGNAENLTRLNIQACNVNGSLPAALTRLASLEQVNMRECGITGELPSSLGDMKALREFYLDHNMELGGTLPDSFYNLENLTDFDISATRIGGHLKPAISRLKKLEGFWITGCEFEGTIPEEFGLIENLIGYDFDGNYFTSLPEFVRYYGYNSKYAKEWVGSAGFPIGVPYYQRKKSDGRPENYVVVVPDCSEMSEILVNGQPLKRPGYYVDFSKCRQLPFPVWARVRYGIWCWTIGRIDEMKYPKYPSADDLQYPGNEYFFDGKDWRHSKLEYPAREYYYDGQNWVHDPSCPWNEEYVDSIGE